MNETGIEKNRLARRLTLGRCISASILLFCSFSSIGGYAFARAASNAGRLTFQSEIIVSADLLTLGDIAQVSDASPEVGARLRSISFGYSPAIGATRELSRERILLALQAAGFEPGDVLLACPPVIRIKRSSQIIDTQSIKEAVEKATLSELHASGAVARLVALELPPVIEAPSGIVEVRASSDPRRALFAPFVVSIEITVDGRVVKRISATARIEAFASVLVAARDLPTGSPIKEPDVKFEVCRLQQPLSSYILDKKHLRGLVARLAYLQGQPLLNSAMSSDIVVKAGDSVRISGGNGSLQVSVIGEARASGRVGEKIQVKNLQSGTLLQAIVEDEGQVRVLF